MRNPPGSFEPWWAPGTDTGFRQRCASALTHPVTVVALATLLLNDLLFKAMWPDAWVTGKLSDLAWVVFALPLLAFLLSLFTRGNVVAARAAFLTSYIGLPLLYAAFNTFEPVHYWILRGISLASGGMGRTHLDATDSIVIPLGWAVATWVWRRPALSPDALRMRLGLLVAGIAVLASIASEPPVEHGVVSVGMTEEGRVVARLDKSVTTYSYRSDDGGITWELDDSIGRDDILRGGDTAETPRGTYAIQGTEIVLLDVSGQPETVYSAEHLSETGNLWVQQRSTTTIRAVKMTTTRPRALFYDERSGNLIVAMGVMGVLVISPDEQLTPYAVEEFTPKDFSFIGKTILLLTHPVFWPTSLAFSLSMTGAALISNRRRTGALKAVRIYSLIASSVILLIFDVPDPAAQRGLGALLVGVAILALLLAIVSVGPSWQWRYWRLLIASMASMYALVVLPFMLWLHQGVSMELAKLSAILLTGLMAFLVAGYIRRRIQVDGFHCPECQQRNDFSAWFCTRCGEQLGNKPRPIIGACPNCKRRNDPTSRFCTRCGHQLRQTHSGQAGVCQFCQHENEETALFCTNCGQEL